MWETYICEIELQVLMAGCGVISFSFFWELSKCVNLALVQPVKFLEIKWMFVLLLDFIYLGLISRTSWKREIICGKKSLAFSPSPQIQQFFLLAFKVLPYLNANRWPMSYCNYSLSDSNKHPDECLTQFTSYQTSYILFFSLENAVYRALRKWKASFGTT